MKGRSRIFHGIGVSSGVAIGRAFLLDHQRVSVRRYHIESDQTEFEIQRLQKAIAISVQQLNNIRARFIGQGHDHHSILEAHEMMLKDRSLLEESAEIIRNQQVNAEWAVSRTIGRIHTLLDQISDVYFKERGGDVDFVGQRILGNLTGQYSDFSELSDFEDGTIVVARNLSPAETTLLSRKKVTAFVTEFGGKTSHTSIMARSLEIPAVVGVHGILDAAGSGDLLVVDGSDGVVMLRPTKNQLTHGRQRAENFQRSTLELLEAKALPAQTLDEYTIRVAGNIESPSETSLVLQRGGEAIGMYRTEFMFMGRTEIPDEEEHYRTYCRLLDEMEDKPVTIRTLDLGGEKVFGRILHEPELNPALGLRAIRYCLKHKELFEPQLAGLLRAAAHGSLRIMLPMISNIDEVRIVREMLHKTATLLAQQGKEHRTDIPLGILIEVPSASLTVDILAKECEFFAIGTNDLLQYLLAIDRTNDKVDYLYTPHHIAVLRILLNICQTANHFEKPVSLCGEMAGDIMQTPLLVAMGVNELSMNAGSIPRIKRLIRELRREECRELLNEALALSSHLAVSELVRSFLRAKTSVRMGLWSGS